MAFECAVPEILIIFYYIYVLIMFLNNGLTMLYNGCIQYLLDGAWWVWLSETLRGLFSYINKLFFDKS